MGRFFKIWPNLSQNWLKFKKILEKIGSFVQNLAQNWADWYMNGLLFLEKLVLVWVYFQILWRHIPTKTELEYSPPPPRVSVVVSYLKFVSNRSRGWLLVLKPGLKINFLTHSALKFWPKRGWKCKIFLKIGNGGHMNSALMGNW